MKKIFANARPGVAALLLLMLAPLTPFAETPPPKERLVVLGGPITEIVFALGAEADVVGVDKTSLYPERARTLPQVGVVRAISAEGVLSAQPTKILSSSSLGPPAAVKQLQQSGVPLVLVENPRDEATLCAAITLLGRETGRESAAAALLARIEKELQAVRALTARRPAPAVVFLMGLGGGLSAAGAETQADGIVTLAGGKNVFAQFRGYKPVSEEAILQARPDFILVAAHTVAGEVSAPKDPKALLRRLGFKSVDALETTQVVPIDLGEYLILGPRTGETALKLARIFAGGAGKKP